MASDSSDETDDLLDNTVERAARLLEAERAQIGHEIHDALIPLIFASSASLTSVLRDRSDALAKDTREKLEQVLTWLDEAQQTGRKLLTQIYPPDFANRPWTVAVIDAVETLTGDSTKCVQWQLATDLNQLPDPIAGAAYRIVIEAVRNAVRHGKASEVLVTGTRWNARYRIVIHDNGVGFDASRIPSDRFGIRSMKGRAELVGGELEVESRPGGPTTVTFTSP